MPLESAKVYTVPDSFPWDASISSGTLTPLEDQSAPFDWTIYGERDKQLARRDVAVASNIVKLSIEIETIWGCVFESAIYCSCAARVLFPIFGSCSKYQS